MRHTISEKAGHLTFHLDESDRDDLEALRERTGNEHTQLAEILDQAGYSGNGVFMPISPEDINALTDAPMLTDELEIKDNGDRVVKGKVWWYPGYETTSFLEVLLTKGSVTFTAA